MKSLIPWKKHHANELAVGRGNETPWDSFHRYMDQQFQSFLSELGMSDWNGWVPENVFNDDPCWVGFDVSETEDEIEIRAELPGVDEKDLSIVLDEDMLIISGEKKSEKTSKKRNMRQSELRYGSFRRVVPLPAGIDRDKVNATFKKGVLSLTIPRTEASRAARKTIPVHAA